MSNSPFLNSIRMDMRQKGYALKTEKIYISLSKVQRILQAMETRNQVMFALLYGAGSSLSFALDRKYSLAY